VKENSLNQTWIECIMIAMLSVNSYPVEKTRNLLPKFRNVKLTDSKFVASSNIATLTVLLSSSGYDRGMLTWRFAERILGLMISLDSGALDSLPVLISSGKVDTALELLCSIRGIGRSVAMKVVELSKDIQ